MDTDKRSIYPVLGGLLLLLLIAVTVVFSISYLLPGYQPSGALQFEVNTPINRETQLAIAEKTAVAFGIPTSEWKGEVAELKEKLKRTDITDEYRRSLEKRLEKAGFLATRDADLLLKFTPGPRNYFGPPTSRGTIYPTPTPTYLPPDGKILWYVQPTFSGVHIENSWVGPFYGRAIKIWAGAYYEDMDQGVLYAESRSDIINSGVRLTPKKAGAVRITGVKDLRLILKAKDGTIFFFDVPSLSFVPSLEAASPATITPVIHTPTPPTRGGSPYPEP
jgi:hypothetical protein